jgi:hypothetical protein
LAKFFNMNTKKISVVVLLLLSQSIVSQTNAKKSSARSSRKDSLSAQRMRLIFDFKTIGMDVAMPSFRNDMVLKGYMFGPTIQYFGFMELGILKGTAHKKNNELLTQNATSFFIGFKYNHILLTRRSLNFGPSFGLRFMLNELKDPTFQDKSEGTGSFGVGPHVGAFVKLGPLFISGKMHVDGNINFSKGSSFNGLSIYPTFGVAFSPMEILMNPKEFTHTAMAHWITDYKSTVTKSREYTASGSVYEVTRYSSTWKDNYGNKTMSCKDMQPFFFIGPRISTNITHFNKTNLLSAYGLNIGVRRGALFLNGFYEKANIHFINALSTNYDSAQIRMGAFKGRIDGEFVNSTKYGAQIGVELINWLQSKDFIYEESRVKRATAFTSIVLFAGYGKAQLGDLKFNSDSGLVSYKNYIAKDQAAITDETRNILLTKKDKQFLSLGVQFGFGAIALNTEYSFYDKANKSLNNWNVGLSYNMPIIRMIRVLKVANLKRKINKLKK